ncbi:MAG: hypothetical protein NTX79_02355 [Candidatus Micrarchaeota archaeon]|nr:hypothetical protein [Candidatus Micrarchaeota archaeon]
MRKMMIDAPFPLAACCAAGLLTFLLLHKWLEKSRGEGFTLREPKLARAGLIFSAGISAFTLGFAGFATGAVDASGLILSCIIGFGLLFMGTFAIGTQLPKQAVLSGRALLAFAGMLYLGIAAIGIISGAMPRDGGAGSVGFVSVKSDFLLWLAIVLAAAVGGISYIYDAARNK